MSTPPLPTNGHSAQQRHSKTAPSSGVWPAALLPRTVARIQNRLAMHVPVRRVAMTNKRPIVSFTFDDVPQSAATLGAQILREHDASGTFYVAGRLAGQNEGPWLHATVDELLALHRAGHELACHTFSHKRLYDLGSTEFGAEENRNADFFRALDSGITLRNFAYPWGIADFRRKPELARRFKTCRGVLPGINHGTIDPHFLHSMPLEEAHTNLAAVDHALDQARDLNGWLVFYGHEVSTAGGEFSCSPQMLRHALAGAQQRGMQIANIADASQLAGI